MHINRIPKWVWWTVAALIAFQIYFFRELVAAEMLFAIGFVVFLLLATVVILTVYGVMEVGDRSVGWFEANGKSLARRVRHPLQPLLALSRKTSRHPHSESAR